MSSQANQSASPVSNDAVETVDEPSMEDILASIKQIIADDADSADALSDRDRYTHPSNPSNSNASIPVSAASVEVSPEAVAAAKIDDAALEGGLKAAMEEELRAMQLSDALAQQVQPAIQRPAAPIPHFVAPVESPVAIAPVQATVESPAAATPARIPEGVPSVEPPVAAAPMQAEVLAPQPIINEPETMDAAPAITAAAAAAAATTARATTMRQPAADEAIAPSAVPAVELEEQPQAEIAAAPIDTSAAVPSQDAASDSAGLSADEKAADLRSELSSSSKDTTVDERLEKYRVRGKMAMEQLAQRRALPPIKPFQPAANAARAANVARATHAAPAQPSVAEAVAAGPVLPTTKAVAEEMAATMMREKSAEIETILAGLMRPVIQQWLGDNLPSLVEKMVREEIERVSRGKQAS